MKSSHSATEAASSREVNLNLLLGNQWLALLRIVNLSTSVGCNDLLTQQLGYTAHRTPSKETVVNTVDVKSVRLSETVKENYQAFQMKPYRSCPYNCAWLITFECLQLCDWWAPVLDLVFDHKNAINFFSILISLGGEEEIIFFEN